MRRWPIVLSGAADLFLNRRSVVEPTATLPPFRVVDEHDNAVFVVETSEPSVMIADPPSVLPNRKARRRAAALARRRRR